MDSADHWGPLSPIIISQKLSWRSAILVNKTLNYSRTTNNLSSYDHRPLHMPFALSSRRNSSVFLSFCPCSLMVIGSQNVWRRLTHEKNGCDLAPASKAVERNLSDSSPTQPTIVDVYFTRFFYDKPPIRWNKLSVEKWLISSITGNRLRERYCPGRATATAGSLCTVVRGYFEHKMKFILSRITDVLMSQSLWDKCHFPPKTSKFVAMCA